LQLTALVVLTSKRARIATAPQLNSELGGLPRKDEMIHYSETKIGDILKIVGAGAPGYAALGELVRVVEVHSQSVFVENRDGERIEFLFNCGAARLEPTEWTKDFPPSAQLVVAVDGAGSTDIEASVDSDRAATEL